VRGVRFAYLASGASLAGALLGVLLMGALKESASDSSSGRALWMGGFFLAIFVLGFAAMQLAMAFDRAYRYTRPPLWWAAFLAACLLLFGIGVGGQYLFMYEKEEVTINRGVDMVLLLDASGSMSSAGYDVSRTEAACQFVDSLGSDCRLQAVSFAGRVLDSSALLKMNAANKDTLKAMITALDASGATDFNEPLEQAMTTLQKEGRKNANHAVILLTDGQSSLESTVINDYKKSDIRVFTIRISTSPSLSYDEEALRDLADDTGGFDTQLVPAADGSIQTTDMLEAFRKAFEATSETEVKMDTDLLVYAEEELTAWQIAVRIVCVMLCAVLFGIGYFGRVSLFGALSSAAVGLVAALLLGALDGVGYYLAAPVLCLLIGTAYVFLDRRGEEQYHV